MTDTQDIIRKGRKFDQVIAGAREVFIRNGYEGASVDDIARAAGVSKATLYNYFPDKRALFLEICNDYCTGQSEVAFELDAADLPLHELLTTGADLIVRFMIAPFTQSVFELVMGEAERFPEIARQFYETGPKLGRQRIVMLMKKYVDRGELEIEDLDLAAEQLVALCKADLWVRVSHRVTENPSEAEIKRIVDGAVSTFLARYGARS